MPAGKRLPSNWIYPALFIAVFAVYAQTGAHAFLNYDDPIFMNEPHVRGGLSLSGIVWAFRYGYAENSFPLTWLSHMADWQFFGAESGPHHLSSVAIHALSTLVLFAFLKKVTAAPWRSAFVAFVFALHPLHLESVAWIAERKDVLCTLFWMLTLWCYADYAEKPSAGRYAITLALFCCGLLSKPMMVSFPFVALLLDWWPLHRFERHTPSRLLVEKVPMVALALGASVVTYMAHQRLDMARVDQVSLAARIGNAFLSYALYLRDFLWPAKLAVFYPYVERSWWLVAGAALAVTVATILAARSYRTHPYIAVGWFWYVGALLPVIGIVQAGAQARADRYTYIPLVGISIIVAWGADELFETRGWDRRLLAGAAVSACAAWGVISWIDLPYWRDSVSLFTHAVEVTDSNYIAYSNLGAAQRQEGKILEAVRNFQQAAAIVPEDAKAQDNLGEALTEAGKLDEATEHLRQAVRLHPEFAKPHVDLGSALIRGRRVGEAEAEYEAALQIEPGDAAAHYGLGGVLQAEGREQEALTHLRKALPLLIAEVQSNPGSVDAHYNLGTLYGILGQTDEAIGEFAQTIQMRPEDAEARFNLGTALALKNRLNEAAQQFSAAVQLAPDYTSAHLSLARVLVALRRYDDAAREYRETLRLNPDRGEARRELEGLKSAPTR